MRWICTLLKKEAFMVLTASRLARLASMPLVGLLLAVASCSGGADVTGPPGGGGGGGDDAGGGPPGDDSAVSEAAPSPDSSGDETALDATGSDSPVTDSGGKDVDNRDVVAQDVFTQDSGGITVTWQGGCWYSYQGHKYQAMRFQLETPNPIPLEGTLFFTTTCDASQGTDNLNDTGGTTGSGGWLYWFIHHPDEYNTSATWSLGNLSSGCVNYATAPDC
jgi:hypothetical protein